MGAVAASVKIALANALIGLAAIACLVAVARRQLGWQATPVELAAAAWAVATLASAAAAPEPARAFGETAELLTLVLVPMTVVLLDRRLWGALVLALAGVGLASAGVGFGQWWGGADSTAHRLDGLATHYTTFAAWTLVVVLLAAADGALRTDEPWRRVLMALAAGAGAAALGLSLGRGAWLGLAAGLAVVLWLAIRTRSGEAAPAGLAPPWRLVVPAALVVAVGCALMAPVVRARAASIVDLEHPSNADRLTMARTAVAMVADRPWLGHGPGNVAEAYRRYRSPAAAQPRIPHLHSTPLQIAVERGLVGVVAWLGMVGTGLVGAVILWRRGAEADRAAAAGCGAVQSGLLVAGLFDYTWGDAEVWILTLVCLAAPWGLLRGSR